jgi:hypothetical protein
MTEKIVMIVSAAFMLAVEILGLEYAKAEVTAAVALIVAIVAAVVGKIRSEAAADALHLATRITETDVLIARVKSNAEIECAKATKPSSAG